MNLADVKHVFIEGAPNHFQFTCPHDQHADYKNAPQPLVMHSYGLPRRCPLCSQVLRNARAEASYAGQATPDYASYDMPTASTTSLLDDVEDAREANLPVTVEEEYHGAKDTKNEMSTVL